MTFDYADYTLMINGNKAGVLLNKEKEKTLTIADDSPSDFYLKFNLFPTSNKIRLAPNATTTIIARRNIPINILGYLSMLVF